MGALTLGTEYATEFAGQFKAVTVLVDGGTQTGTVTVAGLTTIRGAQVTLAEAPSADCQNAVVIGISGNVVTVNEYDTAQSLNTQTAIDFYLTVIGEY